MRISNFGEINTVDGAGELFDEGLLNVGVLAPFAEVFLVLADDSVGSGIGGAGRNDGRCSRVSRDGERGGR